MQCRRLVKIMSREPGNCYVGKGREGRGRESRARGAGLESGERELGSREGLATSTAELADLAVLRNLELRKEVLYR